MLLRISTFVIFIFFGISRSQINTDSVSVLLKNQLDEVMVTGQIGSQTISESVNNLILITSKDIKSTGSNDLAELFSNQALFDLNVDPALGTTVSIQGMQGNNINIMIDGIPVIGRKGSQIDLSQINLSNIDRIEILKGPASVMYGTNSTGGVINLISKKNLNTILFNSYLESIGVYNFNADINKSIRDFDIHVNLGKYDFDGYGYDESRSKYWKPKNQFFSDFKIRKKINKTTFELKTSLFDEEIIDLGDENFFPFAGTANDLHYYTYRNVNFLKINSTDSVFNWNYTGSYSRTNFEKKEFIIDLISENSNQTSSQDFNTLDIFKTFFNRFEYNRFSGLRYKSQLGVDYVHETVEGSKILDSLASIYHFSLFTQSSFELTNKLTTQFGIRLPFHSSYSANLIPSLHFKYDMNTENQLRLSYSRGFRSPTIKELFMEFIDINHNIVGNSDLKPERSNAFQLSLSLIPKINDKIYSSFNIEGFLNFLDNKIELARIQNTDSYTYYNLEKSTYYGTNTFLKLDFKSQLNTVSSFNFMWNMFHIDNSSFNYNKARHNLSFAYKFEYEECNCGLNLNWRIKSKFEYQSYNDQNELVVFEQSGYELLNLNLYKEYDKINSSLIFGVKNLLDVTDVNYAMQDDIHSGDFSTISWGRTFYIQLSWMPF